MNFSHLEDTKFPNLETASPYALKNTFDYTRWVPNTKIHLVNVLWNGDYSNVVKFEDDDARDKWFDAISDSFTLTLTSNARIVPDGSIKLPLPYDVASRYNYLYVDIPLTTSREQLIQDETDSGVRRWYFFVGDVSYSAPNTTVVYLQPDVWTNFIDSARLTYMMLERGHAPVYASDVDSYLSNPVGNNRYLLAPDVNFDDSNVVRDSKYVPVGAGKKYIVIASTTGYKQIQSGESGTVTTGSNFTNPTYSDTSDWYGYQLQVNGYQFGNGKDYSNLKACVNQYNRPGNFMPTSLDTYAIPASDDSFLADVASQSPAFLRTIKAMFVVSEEMINLGTELTLCGHTIYFATGAQKTIDSYPLTKDMFGFDDNEGTFAKLYTYPYSRIEVSDNSGKTSEVRIENTVGSIGVELLVSVAFPILDSRVYLTGVGGVGSQSYTWKNLGDEDMRKQVPNGDWDKLLFDLDIPTFALYMDAETSYMLDSYSSAFTNAREQALTAYHNAVRSANLGYTNGVASAKNAHDNSVRDADTAQSNANASATTVQTNANASADTGQTNAKASASTANSNANDSANTAQTNANAMAGTGQTNTNNLAEAARNNTNATIAAASANASEANSASSYIMTNGNTIARGDTNDTNVVSISTTETNNQTSIATTKTNAEVNKATSVMNGGVSGAMAGGGDPLMGAIGALAMGVTGYVTASISAEAANSNASLTAQAAEDVTNANVNANSNIVGRHILAAQQDTARQNTARTNQTNNNNSALGTQRDNNYNAATTNASNLYNTQTANSARTRNTAVTNAGRTLTTSNENADRTRNTAVANAQRQHDTTVANATRTHDANVTDADNTQTTSNENSTRTREVGILNAKETLETAQDTASHAFMDARRGAPSQLTEVTGDGANMYYGMNGIQFRLRTQSDSAIAQTAAQFARYGYALNQIWDVESSGLNLMKHFTYWKAADIWVDVRNVASSEVGDAIQRMFENGVTVWSDPNEIGKVGIYDN